MTKDYQQLFENSVKGTPEHAAYYCIINALKSQNVIEELSRLIEKAQASIGEHDQQVWNSREGYRGYYDTKITLYREAIDALGSTHPYREECPCDACVAIYYAMTGEM